MGIQSSLLFSAGAIAGSVNKIKENISGYIQKAEVARTEANKRAIASAKAKAKQKADVKARIQYAFGVRGGAGIVTPDETRRI